MKKRVISLMLVLVTVIGLLPLSLLAADTTASATTETVNAAQYLENAGIPRKDIIGVTDFEGFSDAKKEELTKYDIPSYAANADGVGFFSESSSSTLVFVGNKTGYEWVTEAGGNTAIKINGNASTTYIDVRNRAYVVPTAEQAALAKDKTFVFKMDLKAGSSLPT